MGFTDETPRTLRAYFLLVGVIGTLEGFASVTKENQQALVTVFSVVALGVAIGFLYCGLRMQALLDRAPQHINVVLFGALGLGIVRVVVLLLYDAPGTYYIWPAISIGIALYLLAQVKRLSKKPTPA